MEGTRYHSVLPLRSTPTPQERWEVQCLGGQESTWVALLTSMLWGGFLGGGVPHAWRHPRAARGFGTPTVEMHGNGLVLRQGLLTRVTGGGRPSLVAPRSHRVTRAKAAGALSEHLTSKHWSLVGRFFLPGE